MKVINLRAGNIRLPCLVTAERGRLFIEFPYNKALLAEIKCMQNARWHGFDTPPRKCWSIKDCARNRFQLDYLAGKDPYARYDADLVDTMGDRSSLRDYQVGMLRHMVTRRHSIITGEMGLGKTLAAIEALEFCGYTPCLWVGTGSSIPAAKLEFEKWDAKVWPHKFVTYDGLKKLAEEGWHDPVQAVIFDECQRLKTPNSLTSLAAQDLTDAMRRKWGMDSLICLMSGDPAPNSPLDWWKLCEISCPGFLKEGTWWKLRERLCILSEHKSASDQTFQKIDSWKESEVEILGQRMEGLNVTYLKKDCLELPELQHKIIEIKQDADCKKAEEFILDMTPQAVTAIVKLMQLADGFQYSETSTGKKVPCPLCLGTGESTEYYGSDDYTSGDVRTRKVICEYCNGEKTIKQKVRRAESYNSAKLGALETELRLHEDVGRFVCYAAFTESIDLCVDKAIDLGWDVIRADGRGWKYLGTKAGVELSRTDMLKAFQKKPCSNRLAFIGHPRAAGTGLTLTASPSIFFYSNSFNYDDRVQAINRIHRLGMDENRGATIIDCNYLSTDEYVRDNLMTKKHLLNLTLGGLKDACTKHTS